MKRRFVVQNLVEASRIPKAFYQTLFKRNRQNEREAKSQYLDQGRETCGPQNISMWPCDWKEANQESFVF